MTQLTINVDDRAILPHLKKVLSAIDGVSIAKPARRKRRCGLDEALDDVRAGRINHYDSAEGLFQQILGD
jgi:hypothetical protein